MKHFSRLARAAFGVTALLLLAGCSHYRLGTGAELPYATVYVAPVTNAAIVPQAVALVTREVRAALVRDGRVRLAEGPRDADAILTLTLADYGREMTTAQAQDTGLARKFDVTLRATGTLRDGRTDAIFFEDRAFDATRQVFTDGGQLPAEYQTLPQLASVLADRVAHAVLDVW